MKRATIAAGAATAVLVLLAGTAGSRVLRRDAVPAVEIHASHLYGRITTTDGETHEGRLRFGGEQEAFWGDYFNGVRDGNPWAAQVPDDRLPTERRSVEIAGFELLDRERRVDLDRPFMARFGDIDRIEARGRDLTVTLRNGTVVELDRYGADDFADGLRVWEHGGEVVELDEREIRSIEFLAPTGSAAPAPSRLHGTVRTSEGSFTGFLEWNREGAVGGDRVEGHAADGELLDLPFATVASIARRSGDSSTLMLTDGSEVVLSGTSDVGEGHRGIYVDDPRYGRVLVSWDAFERVDFTAPGGSVGGGPGYEDFPPGRPLAGSVTTRGGERLAGRLVFDLDESETTETLDAPSRGVDYTLPFGLVSSIVLPGGEAPAADRATVLLRSGETLRLELDGDLGDGNAGLLVFPDGRGEPEYVPWTEVERVDLDPPAESYPPVG